MNKLKIHNVIKVSVKIRGFKKKCKNELMEIIEVEEKIKKAKFWEIKYGELNKNND